MQWSKGTNFQLSENKLLRSTVVISGKFPPLRFSSRQSFHLKQGRFYFFLFNQCVSLLFQILAFLVWWECLTPDQIRAVNNRHTWRVPKQWEKSLQSLPLRRTCTASFIVDRLSQAEQLPTLPTFCSCFCLFGLSWVPVEFCQLFKCIDWRNSRAFYLACLYGRLQWITSWCWVSLTRLQ